MSSCSRLLPSLFGSITLLTLLAGCGFKPLYGVDSASHAPATAQQFAQTEIPAMPNRIGQEMRNLLIDSLHPSGAATDYKYRLNVSLHEVDIALGVQQTSISTRGQVRITAEYWLVDETSGKTLLRQTLRTSTGYNILIDEFGSLISTEDARDRGLQDISDNMTLQLAAYFSRPPPKT